MLNRVEQLLDQGKAQQALPLIAEHTQNNPRDAHAWFLLGVCHHQANQLQEALHALERTLDLEPRHIQARSAKGAILCDLGRPQEALHVYRKALHLAPTDAQLLLNIAVVLEQLGDLHTALERYNLLLKHHPDFSSALLNRGALLIRLGRLDEAGVNNRRLVDLNPEWESAQFNLGEVLLAQGCWGEALAAYQRALIINPHSAKSHFATGLALSMLKSFDEAQQAFITAQTIAPALLGQRVHDAVALTGGELRKLSPMSIYLLKEATRLDVCDWDNWDDFVCDFDTLINCSLDQDDEIVEPALLFRACALPVSAANSLALAKSVSAWTAATVGSCQKFNHERKPTGKLRIGYVSPDYRVHPIATVTRHLYTLHDRDKFEIYGYSLHPGDGSDIRRDIEHGCDFFRELSNLDNRAAAEVIYRDGIDILIDLAGYTTHARPEIFAMRPAPLQACYLGFLHTTGADYIDYFIADPVVLPERNRNFFTENIAYLPNSYFLFDNQQEISSLPITREELGLPAQGFVFCCHNSNYKITPRDFDLWMRILLRVPGSVLWLYKSSEVVAGNLRKEAEARGVNTDRLVFATFAPNEVYLARYRMADLFLDTLFYNAQTTAAEALWTGLPVLTCRGITLSSRVASGLLSALDLNELVCDSAQEYEERAVFLASQPGEIMRIKAALEKGKLTSSLFNTEHQVKKIETAFLAMWQRHEANLQPETLFVTA